MAGLVLLPDPLIAGCGFQRRGQAVRRIADFRYGKGRDFNDQDRSMWAASPWAAGRPVTIQSMTNTRTDDVAATVAQIRRLEAAGCQIVRVAVP